MREKKNLQVEQQQEPIDPPHQILQEEVMPSQPNLFALNESHSIVYTKQMRNTKSGQRKNKVVFEILKFIVALALIILVHFTEAKTTHTLLEKQWIVQTLAFVMCFWLLVLIFEWIQDKTSLSVFDLKYNLFVLLSFIGAIIGLSYLSYLSWNIDESLTGHDDNTWGVVVHEIFLVMRLLCLGFVIMLCISFFAFAFFLISENSSNSAAALEANQDNEQQSDPSSFRRRATIRKELDVKGKSNRLQGIPFRQLMLKEGRQCFVCLERLSDNQQVVQLACNSQHIYHLKCLQDWAYAGHQHCPICKCQIEL